MIALLDDIGIEEAIDLMTENGTRHDVISRAVSLVLFEGGMIKLGIDRSASFMLVAVGELDEEVCLDDAMFGVSRRSPKDRYNFARGFTIALLRAVSMKD